MKTLWKALRKTFTWFGLLILFSLFSGGCQTAKEDRAFSPVPDERVVDNDDSIRRLVPGEVIVFSLPDAIPHEERIKDDGTITLPKIGAIRAAGKTSIELQREIYNLYVPQYYKSLPFSVGRRIYHVIGEVRASGRHEYIGPLTVLKAIVSAGDFTDSANRKKVILTRANGQRIIVNCAKAAGDSSLDLEVFPEDKIEVPKRFWK